MSEFKVTASVNSIAKGPKATAQRHMLSPKVTLNTMGFRVNLRENMCLCTHGLVLSDFKLTSSG